MTSPLLLTNGSPERQGDSDNGCGDTHYGSKGINPLALVGDLVVLRKASHDLGCGGRNGVSDLISDAWERSTELRWRKFVQVNGNDAPSSLDHELEEEGTGGQTGLGFWQDPGRDQNCGTEARDDDGASTTDGLGDVSDDGSTDDCSDLGINRTTGRICFRETLAGDEEGGVGILGGMGEVVEESHQLKIAAVRTGWIVIPQRRRENHSRCKHR